MRDESWLTEPLAKPEEFEKLHLQTGLGLKEWVLQRLMRRPLYFGHLSGAAKMQKGASPQELVKTLKESLIEGYKFCLIANLQGKRFIRTPMIFIRGTKDKPFLNCSNCPVPKENCKVWKERRR